MCVDASLYKDHASRLVVSSLNEFVSEVDMLYVNNVMSKLQ